MVHSVLETQAGLSLKWQHMSSLLETSAYGTVCFFFFLTTTLLRKHAASLYFGDWRGLRAKQDLISLTLYCLKCVPHGSIWHCIKVIWSLFFKQMERWLIIHPCIDLVWPLCPPSRSIISWRRRRGRKYVNRSVPWVLLMFEHSHLSWLWAWRDVKKFFTGCWQLTVYLTLNADFSNAQWWSHYKTGSWLCLRWDL